MKAVPESKSPTAKIQFIRFETATMRKAQPSADGCNHEASTIKRLSIFNVEPYNSLKSMLSSHYLTPS
jgi:hypothetical protein